MRNYLFGFFVFVFLAGVLTAGDIVTKSGTVYKNAEIERATERGLLIMHETGAAVIPYSNLPDDLQKKYQTDAERFKAARAAAKTAVPTRTGNTPDSTSGTAAATMEIKKYWQTASSKKVHNASCRYYKTSSGEMVSDLNGGTNCKICGGTGKGAFEKRPADTTKTTSGTSTETTGTRTIHTGPRGGRYYINSNGKKTYIRKNK